LFQVITSNLGDKKDKDEEVETGLDWIRCKLMRLPPADRYDLLDKLMDVTRQSLRNIAQRPGLPGSQQPPIAFPQQQTYQNVFQTHPSWQPTPHSNISMYYQQPAMQPALHVPVSTPPTATTSAHLGHSVPSTSTQPSSIVVTTTTNSATTTISQATDASEQFSTISFEDLL
jgi:hypothetical protein